MQIWFRPFPFFSNVTSPSIAELFLQLEMMRVMVLCRDPSNQHALATQVCIFTESCVGRRCSVAAAMLFDELETQNWEGRWIAFLQWLWKSWSKSETYWITCILHQPHRKWDIRSKILINEIKAYLGGECSVT